MKKIFAVLSVLMFATFAVFAQADLQPLAVVKLNKNESITLKQLKTRCEAYEKQIGRALTVDERKQVLDTLIEETLIVQAAQKAGISIPDSSVYQYFAQSMSQSLGVSVTEKELEDIGVNIVIYANHLLRSAYPAALKTAQRILECERAKEASDEYCMPLAEIVSLI